MIIKGLIALVLAFSAMTYAEEVFSRSFAEEKDLVGLYGEKEKGKIVELEDGSKALEISVAANDPVKNAKVSVHVSGAKIAGKKVVFTAEVKPAMGEALKKWGGGSFVVWAKVPGGKKDIWQQDYIGPGKKDWKKVQILVDFPEGVKFALLSLGITNAEGKIYFRNVKIVASDETK